MPTSINRRVEVTGVDTSDWVVLGSGVTGGYGSDNVGLQVDITGTATVTIEATLNVDLVVGDEVVPAGEIFPIGGLEDITAGALKGLNIPVKAVRLNQTAGDGTSGLTVLQPNADNN